MLLSHGGSEYNLRSRTVRGVPLDRLKLFRSVRKKSRSPIRVSRSKSPKLPKEKGISLGKKLEQVDEEGRYDLEIAHPNPSKLVGGVEQEAVGGGTDTEDSDSEPARPVFHNMVFGKPPPLLSKPGAAEYQTHKCTERALSEWNETKEPKYELVKPVRSSAGAFPQGLVLHCNFEAKRRDDPEALVELFFAQLFRPWNECHVGANIFESLGLRSSFPDDDEECTDCNICFHVRHPKNREFMGMPID